MDITLPATVTLAELLSLLIQGALVILILVFIFVGIRVLKILGAVQQLTASISEIVDTVNLVLWQPVRFVSTLSSTIRKFLGLKR